MDLHMTNKALPLERDEAEARGARPSSSADATRKALVGWVPFKRDPSIASVRIRCLHPLAHLRRHDYPVELFDPKDPDKYGAVLFSKRYDRKSLETAQVLKQKGVRIVFDLCDNYFYNPVGRPKRKEQAERLRRFIDIADRVVVSTEALAEIVYAETSPSDSVVVIGDAVEENPEGFSVAFWRAWLGSVKARRWTRQIRALRGQGRNTIVWFGNHGSAYADGGGVRDIKKIRDVLEEVDHEFPLALTVISNSKSAYREAVGGWSIPTQYVEWDLRSSARIIGEHDIAVIPIDRNPFTLCKTNNRLAFALHLGVPVVADSIPSYEPFSEACFLDDWEGGLKAYLSDGGLRDRHLATGRAIIGKDWTVQNIARKWAILFDSVLQG